MEGIQQLQQLGPSPAKPSKAKKQPNQAPQPKTLYPPPELLEDLCSRFVLNAPEEELKSFERIGFLIELAHWFYEDHVREQQPALRSFSLSDFIAAMFKHCAALRPYGEFADEIYRSFTDYKVKVPTTGAILLNPAMDKCVMVRGWKQHSAWGFPKGKKNFQEEDLACAIREVEEEIGYNIGGHVNPEDFLEVEIAEQRCRLYIVTGVEESTPFLTRTKKEIGEIAWHWIADLPDVENEDPDNPGNPNKGANGLKYFLVWPYMRGLKNWIAARKAPGGGRSKRKKGLTGPSNPTSSGRSAVAPPPSDPAPATRELPQMPAVEFQASDVPSGTQPTALYSSPDFSNFRFDVARILPLLTFPEKVQHASL
ncbi:NUDIX hydrolase domain containing protein [Klebsormidium nitens]|uniref:NUDIX hydrolase domain containing protein n=1 Tax=Klebsormidium nitens TaxID=105231 RepID=A0A1Y1I5T4_KLENI|nr:NUDIX hydrolase domain containing protein [Klebsormidium nitens]|eukprot:GAQ86324.1 NUDIX hydrolase domain containing protein [Klebsormidium nitens]